MRYKVTAPAAGFSGDIAGAVFVDGAAVVDDSTHKAALAYCRRRGYTVEPLDAPVEQEGDVQPKKSASKAAWVTHAVSQGMDEADAEQLTRDQLVERFAIEGEGQ